MTAISLINPYAPQPVTGPGADLAISTAATTLPLRDASARNNMGASADNAGQGTGNGTGTGGAELAVLLDRRRAQPAPQLPSPKSIIEALATTDPATAFLERQAQKEAEAKVADRARLAEIAADRAAAEKAEASKAQEPPFEPPNPLPTAPILQREKD